MRDSPGHSLAASVFILGLFHGFVRREDVVGWADRQMETIDEPPGWLIDLSLSQNLHWLDVISLLRPVAAGVDPVTTTTAVYALLPGTVDLSFEEARALARRLYRITYDCLGGDWQYPLPCEMDAIADTFDFVIDGYSTLSDGQAMQQLHELLSQHRDSAVVDLLQPVTWSVCGGGTSGA